MPVWCRRWGIDPPGDLRPPPLTLTPLTWLTAGAIMGNANRLRHRVPDASNSAQAAEVLPKKSGIPTVL